MTLVQFTDSPPMDGDSVMGGFMWISIFCRKVFGRDYWFGSKIWLYFHDNTYVFYTTIR